MDYREQLLQGLEHANVQLDQEKIMRAYAIAAQEHEGQTRTSGEPYISHPVAVALILIEMDCDTDTVIAALLHDTLEDTDLSPQVIKREFGADVLLIVEGVSKLRHINYTTKEDAQAENLRKMLLAMVRDIRVILIKLADRCTICARSTCARLRNSGPLRLKPCRFLRRWPICSVCSA